MVDGEHEPERRRTRLDATRHAASADHTPPTNARRKESQLSRRTTNVSRWTTAHLATDQRLQDRVICRPVVSPFCGVWPSMLAAQVV